MTTQDEKAILKLLEYQTLSAWLGKMTNLMGAINQQLAKKNGDIHLLLSQKNLKHDIDQISKCVIKDTKELVDYFEVRYGIKLKSLENRNAPK